MAQKEISAFLPAYNEEENIRHVLDDLVSILKEVTSRYEVIVVLYEGSTDRTEEVVREYMVGNETVRLIRQPLDRKGYGVALKLGIRNCRYGLIFYTDADDQYDVRDIRKLLAEIDNADIVSGRRWKRRDQKMRLLTAAVYNRLIRILFPTGVRDIDSAFKLYRKEVLDKIDLTCDSGLADAEILAKARSIGARIVEVPISHFPRTRGKPVFEVSALGRLGVIHPRVVARLLYEMAILWKDLHGKGRSVANGIK